MQEPEIIEAEIVENATNAPHYTVTQQGLNTPAANKPPTWHTPHDHARPQGDSGGLLGGFLVLAVGFIVTVAVGLFCICILIPVTLLMRLLGVHKRN